MRVEYLESEDLFTSNGLFKIRNKFSGKNFPIFSQKFVPTLVIPVIETPTVMVQSACKPSDSEDEVEEEEVEEVNEETTEEVVVVTKEEIQDSKLSNSESPVMVENEEPTEIEAKDTSMKLEDLQGEDEAVVFEMEPANVSMGNVSMEQIDVTEESFEQASDLVVLTPTEKNENEVETEEKSEEITEDLNEEIETAANQVIADSIEGAISEVTNLNEIVEDKFVEETEDGAAEDGARKCEDSAPEVVACQSPPPDFVIQDNEGTEGDQNDVIEEATINEEVSAPNKCDDAGPDVIACQSPPADFVTPDDEIKLDNPIIEAPAIMVCSSYQQSDSEESADEQTEEVKDIVEDITVDDGAEVTSAKKCENAAPEVIACQSPPADFIIPAAEDQNNETKDEKSKKIEAEDVAPNDNNEERSASVIENAIDSPATEDTKPEGQTEIKTDESNVVTKDCPKPTQQKYIARDDTSLKLLTGQAMNLALSYATFIIKDTNLQHNLENYRVG